MEEATGTVLAGCAVELDPDPDPDPDPDSDPCDELGAESDDDAAVLDAAG